MLKKLLVAGFLISAVVNVFLIRNDIQATEERVLTPPKIRVFQTKFKDGTQIVFNHEQHTQTYGLECIQCHHVEKCSRCHQKQIAQTEVEESKVAFHKRCMTCHRDLGAGPVQCLDCHKQ